MILDGQLLVILKYPLTVGRSMYIWNHLQSPYQNVIFHQLRANKLKDYSVLFPSFLPCYAGIVRCHKQNFHLIHD